MNLALWIVQGLLAFAMAGAGAFKITTPHDKLSQKMKWAETWQPGRVKLLGLVVPWLMHILPVLTPVAALCLFVLMAGAVKTHLDLEEPAAPPAVLAVLCLVVAVGRSGLV